MKDLPTDHQRINQLTTIVKGIPTYFSSQTVPSKWILEYSLLNLSSITSPGRIYTLGASLSHNANGKEKVVIRGSTKIFKTQKLLESKKRNKTKQNKTIPFYGIWPSYLFPKKNSILTIGWWNLPPKAFIQSSRHGRSFITMAAFSKVSPNRSASSSVSINMRAWEPGGGEPGRWGLVGYLSKDNNISWRKTK